MCPELSDFHHPTVWTPLRHNLSSQVGGAYSYDCSFGYIPNVELMKFISLATFGSYLPSCPEVNSSPEMNIYHRALLTYSFLKTPESMNSEYFCGASVRGYFPHLHLKVLV